MPRTKRRATTAATKKAKPPKRSTAQAAPPKPVPGTIGWHDLTVDDADRVRDFYAKVAGWKPVAVAMDGYSDWAMQVPGGGAGSAVAGVCWRRGVNADVPPQWLLYIHVASLGAALASCRKLGGEVVAGPREVGGGRFAVIRDPAGAVCALYQS